MRAYSVDYKKRDGGGRHWFHRGFWLMGVTRPLSWCRILGHRAVVDGTGPRRGDLGRRWVVCDRCGVRPDPQGNLDPQRWSAGDRYTGGWGSPAGGLDRGAAEYARWKTGFYPPGGWEARYDGVLGAELVAGPRQYIELGFSLKVGNAGSEHTLAASVHLPLVALFLHTERFGRWVQRRLNPAGYHSRMIALEVHDGRLWWQLWAKRDESSRDDPWWMRGSVLVDPRTILLGPKLYNYADRGSPATVTVRMPHGDSHEVRVQLQRVAHGRRRWRKRLSWAVDWQAEPGVPTKPGGRGQIIGSGVKVPDCAVVTSAWSEVAAERIAEQVTAWRMREDWLPDGVVEVAAR